MDAIKTAVTNYFKRYGLIIFFLMMAVGLTILVTLGLAYHPEIRDNFWRYAGVSVVPLLVVGLMTACLRYMWDRSKELTVVLGIICGAALATAAIKLVTQFNAATLPIVGGVLLAALCFHGNVHGHVLPRSLRERWNRYWAETQARREHARRAQASQSEPRLAGLYTDHLGDLDFAAPSA